MLVSNEIPRGEERSSDGELRAVFADVSGYSALEKASRGPRKCRDLKKRLFRQRARQTMTGVYVTFSWRKKMLAIQIAAEINQRWSELEQLPTIDRLHMLESLVERHVLATGPCCTSTYVPSYEGSCIDFDSRRMNDEE
jgi:hypothetical protein